MSLRYWWVNQNQTFRHEIRGGYLWSPQRNANGARNPFYESMREVSPGDIIFSFVDTRIYAVGIAQSHCYECPKPDEFGKVGHNWNQIGWRTDVTFTREPAPVRPKDHMDILAPLLPHKYAPLQANGNGLQGVYLTKLDFDFTEALARLMGRPILDLVRGHVVRNSEIPGRAPEAVQSWEDAVSESIEADATLGVTDKLALIQARRGQGRFRQNVRRIEKYCRITRVDRAEHLRASHCKPWRDASNEERLDGENGLFLTPSIDHLFDRGFISFADNGSLLISPVAHLESVERMGVPTRSALNVGQFTEGQKQHLEFHRERVFLARG